MKCHKDDGGNVYNSLKFCIILGQCAGILPQEGLSDPANLYFKWKSLRVAYTFIIMSLLGLCSVMCYIHSLPGSFTLDHLVSTIFFMVGLATLTCYLLFARDFAHLIHNWIETDQVMNRDYGYPKKLDLRLKVVTIIAMLLLLGDYIFGVAFHMLKFINGIDNDFESNLYFKTTFPAIFYRQSNYRVFAVFASVLPFAWIATWLCTFIWTFNDLFIIIISTVLALRFKQINDCLAQNEWKLNSNEFWIYTRKNYDLLAILCKKLDGNISLIVLLSFASNILFVLIELLYSFRTIDETLEKVYFFYTFSHLIIRLLAVSLYAAWINDESKEPVNILHSLPSATYNMEIRRLMMQISFDSVALTGSKMFKITRGLILSVASAIVTYELVLIQFSTAATAA